LPHPADFTSAGNQDYAGKIIPGHLLAFSFFLSNSPHIETPRRCRLSLAGNVRYRGRSSDATTPASWLASAAVM